MKSFSWGKGRWEEAVYKAKGRFERNQTLISIKGIKDEHAEVLCVEGSFEIWKVKLRVDVEIEA